MSNKSGWVGLNREVRAAIFARIDEACSGPGRPPRKDLAKLLVYAIADNADFADIPERAVYRGVWCTSYGELRDMFGCTKRCLERAIDLLEKQGLIARGLEYWCQNRCRVDNTGAVQPKVMVPKGLVLNAIFYNDLTDVSQGNRCRLEESNGTLFKSSCTAVKNIKKEQSPDTGASSQTCGPDPASKLCDSSLSNSKTKGQEQMQEQKQRQKEQPPPAVSQAPQRPVAPAQPSGTGGSNGRPHQAQADQRPAQTREAGETADCKNCGHKGLTFLTPDGIWTFLCQTCRREVTFEKDPDTGRPTNLRMVYEGKQQPKAERSPPPAEPTQPHPGTPMRPKGRRNVRALLDGPPIAPGYTREQWQAMSPAEHRRALEESLRAARKDRAV